MILQIPQRLKGFLSCFSFSVTFCRGVNQEMKDDPFVFTEVSNDIKRLTCIWMNAMFSQRLSCCWYILASMFLVQGMRNLAFFFPVINIFTLHELLVFSKYSSYVVICLYYSVLDGLLCTSRCRTSLKCWDKQTGVPRQKIYTSSPQGQW